MQQYRGCLGSNSQGDLEEIPQSVHTSTVPIHGTKSTITLTYLKEAQIWLKRVCKELRGAYILDLRCDWGGQRILRIVSEIRSRGETRESLSM